VETAFVIDSEGNISDQIDLVIFDRHFSPFLFREDGACYIPAESVYAVFEIKQIANISNLLYAAKKAQSVRKLKRTSVSITHAGGKHLPVVPKEIVAGFLALTMKGKRTILPRAFIDRLKALPTDQRLSVVCVLQNGAVYFNSANGGPEDVQVFPADQALITFFLSLLSRLQALGSVPAMDIKAYEASLNP
jgi:hypothetical protein